MLRLTSLAPDTVEAILRSDEPDGLSLEKLRKDLPARWEEQRKTLGLVQPGMATGRADATSRYGNALFESCPAAYRSCHSW